MAGFLYVGPIVSVLWAIRSVSGESIHCYESSQRQNDEYHYLSANKTSLWKHIQTAYNFLIIVSIAFLKTIRSTKIIFFSLKTTKTGGRPNITRRLCADLYFKLYLVARNIVNV